MASSTDQPSSLPHIRDIQPLVCLPPLNAYPLGSLATAPSVASLGSSIETAPTSLSPMMGSDGSPSHSSPEVIELSSLLADIQSHYTTQEPDSPSLPKNSLSQADSASLPRDVGCSQATGSLPVFLLLGLKFHVSGPASHTRAHRSDVADPSTVPNSSSI
ncbi:hypothetical protein HAX54_017997 [Datura stramonium]|uniref:Uncharacterized protein n=1 Tax=Datura stramonium TaxID=4076 RepID=A0ABS8S1P2_DATST|nr:hypothetical protein [Datura stramonium]